jgi:REP element-mobilizing transposase RayT
MNRGVARRTLFESIRDVRMFLYLLALRVRAGDIEVHAYSLLPNHFHLLLKSPHGRLSRAMQRTLDRYAGWFNRVRGRDGPLFRGRFRNRIVENATYWATLVRYIDRNPVRAGLVLDPSDYPHGSAWHYVRSKGPPWLARSEVEAWTRESNGGTAFRPEDYRRLAAREHGRDWIVEKRLESQRSSAAEERDPFGDLVGASGEKVRDWYRKAEVLADGAHPGWTLVGPDTVRGVLATHLLNGSPPRDVLPGDRDLLEAGMLRRLCGMSLSEVAAFLGTSKATVQSRFERYVAAARSRPDFLATAALLFERALAREADPPPR